MNSYFYLQADKNPTNADFLEKLQTYSEETKSLIYVLNRPLTDQKYSYAYSQSLIILSPKHKIAIIDFGNMEEKFENYVEDVIEDIGSIADKYLYKDVIGRPRQWRKSLMNYNLDLREIVNTADFFLKLFLTDDVDKKKLELLIHCL